VKRYALAAAFLLAGPSAALANHEKQGSAPMQQGADCVPEQGAQLQQPGVQSDIKPVSGFEAGTYQWTPGTKPSAKTPKPSKIKERYSVSAGQTPSAKTPK
jgi:hypothetical protein